MTDVEASATAPAPAGLFRRLAAAVYDSLLLLAVLFLGTLALLPLTGGEAITPQDSGPWEHLYRAWIVALTAGFFGLSWTRRGQTLGMMSWKIRLSRDDGTPLRWRHVLGRLAVGLALVVAAAAGLWRLRSAQGIPELAAGAVLLLPVVLNYGFARLDTHRRTLQDRLTGCRVTRTG